LYIKEQLVKQGILPPRERARLRAVPDTLSEQVATKDFVLDDFRAAPELDKWGRVTIVQRAKLVRSVVGLRSRAVRDVDARGARGNAWRHMLYPRGVQ
jgi:hypothetical protein